MLNENASRHHELAELAQFIVHLCTDVSIIGHDCVTAIITIIIIIIIMFSIALCCCAGISIVQLP